MCNYSRLPIAASSEGVLVNDRVWRSQVNESQRLGLAPKELGFGLKLNEMSRMRRLGSAGLHAEGSICLGGRSALVLNGESRKQRRPRPLACCSSVNAGVFALLATLAKNRSCSGEVMFVIAACNLLIPPDLCNMCFCAHLKASREEYRAARRFSTAWCS